MGINPDIINTEETWVCNFSVINCCENVYFTISGRPKSNRVQSVHILGDNDLIDDPKTQKNEIISVVNVDFALWVMQQLNHDCVMTICAGKNE